MPDAAVTSPNWLAAGGSGCVSVEFELPPPPPPPHDDRIIAIANTSGFITSMCGAQSPQALEEKLRGLESDDAATLEVGVEWATQQCRELLERGVPGIHFYTMNKSPATRRIFQALLNR